MKVKNAVNLFMSVCFAGLLAGTVNGAEKSASAEIAPEVLRLGSVELMTPAKISAAETVLNPLRVGKRPRHLKRSPGLATTLASPMLAPSAAVSSGTADPGLTEAAPPMLIGPVFNGVNNNSGLLLDPPDTEGAAGLRHFVEIVNPRVAIYETYANEQTVDPPVRKRHVDQRAFYGVPELADGDLFDGRVLFDNKQKRWVFVSADGSDPSRARLVLAVSKTGNPLGDYYRYRYSIPPASVNGANFWDFPMLGYNKDAIFISGNMYAGDSYVYAALLVIPKSVAYQGQPLMGALFKNLAGTLATPVVFGNGANAFFLAAEDGLHLHLLKGTNLGNVNKAKVSLQARIQVPAYAAPYPVAQPDTYITVDASDARFTNTSTQYGNVLWNIHTIDRNGYARPKFYQIDTVSNKVIQSGFFGRSGTSDDFNASIAVNKSGDAFVTWTSINASMGIYPSMVFSGFSAGQYSNVPAIRQGKVVASSKFSYLTDFTNPQRWGDYSAVSLDPRTYSLPSGSCAAGKRAWIVNEKANSEDAWGTVIGRIGFC